MFAHVWDGQKIDADKIYFCTYSEVIIGHIQDFDTTSTLQQLWVHDPRENAFESLLLIVDWDDLVGLVVIIPYHHTDPNASRSANPV